MPFIKVSKHHELYYEDHGHPQGKTFLFLHGGPGASFREKDKRFFNLEEQRLILFDQRGCGKSVPFGSLEDNTTTDLVEDIEKLRSHLNIESFFLTGASWGTCLALCYALKYPNRVNGLVLRGLFLGTEWELDWLYKSGADYVFPDKFEAFNKIVKNDDPIKSYWDALNSAEEAIVQKAYLEWNIWETYTSSMTVEEDFIETMEIDEIGFNITKFEIFYFMNKCFLESGNYILDNVSKINHIPIHIIHGRRDLVCPPKAPWLFSKLHENTELFFVEMAAHGSSEPGVEEKIMGSLKSI